MKESSEKKIQRLKEHSQMLGQIASEVSEYCDHPECTTLSAVRLMKAELLELQSDRLRDLAFEQIYKIP